jgi:hypothetical protein
MKLVIFTTCKPFIGDDSWRQEQAIKSWTLLTNIEVKIIIIGESEGVKDICDKYKLIYEPNVKTFNGVPYLYSMMEIACKYSSNDDILLWTNSDIIFFQELVTSIKNIVPLLDKDYLLIGKRLNWMNPKILPNNLLNYNSFKNNINFNSVSDINISKIESSKFECNMGSHCNADYAIFSKSTFINRYNKNLVIAGDGVDLKLIGCALVNNIKSIDISRVNPCVHQNHGTNTLGSKSRISMEIFNNNISCREIMSSITDVPFTVDKEYKIHHRENISDMGSALSSLQNYSLWLMLNDIKFNNNHNVISINGKPVMQNLKK